MLTQSTIDAIETVWYEDSRFDTLSDKARSVRSNMEALEYVIENEGLSLAGYPDADQEVYEVATEMGWDKFMNELDKTLQIYIG